MKQLLLSLTILGLILPESRAQQYQCVQPGVKRFFANGHHYLRGMRIDSTVTVGNNTVFYPFRSPRAFGGFYTYDSVSGSWLGKRIIQQPDGITHFENRRGDSVIIKTAAATGAQWNFYSDTTATHYRASVTGTDTMTVLGQLDSVKTIAIQAMQGNTVLVNDPVSRYIIRLSKNHGLVQAFDFFTFPYRDTSYSAFALQDDFLQLNPYTDTSYAAFRILEYHNPPAGDIYDFAPGDMLESGAWYFPGGTSAIYYVTSAWLDSIISRQVTGPNIIYSMQVKTAVYTAYNSPGAPNNTVYQSHVDQLIIPGGPLAVMDSLKMPEEGNNSFIYYYDPADTTHCITGALYKRQQYYIPRLFEGPMPEAETWKAGLGLIDSVNGARGEPPGSYTGSLSFSRKNFTNCGTYESVTPLAVPGVSSLKGVTVFPNPASDMLTVSSDAASVGGVQISLSDVNGSVLRRYDFAGGSNMNLSVKDLPAGLYFLRLSGNGGSWVLKIFVAHGE